VKKILLVFLLLPALVRAGAPVSGRVADAANGEPLPYVTVVVKGKEIGVISDREGRFEIRGRTDISTADSVVFSHVGFETLTRTVGELTGGQDIRLRQGTYDIEPIVVTNRRSRLVKLGHSASGTGMVQVGWYDELGLDDGAEKNSADHEGGVPIRIRHDSDILSFAMRIRQNGYERALFRLSFYSLEDNTPGELIVHRDIRFELADRTTGLFGVDLTPYGIRLAGGQEILVTLTLLEDEMNTEVPEPFMLDGALLGRGVYSRSFGDETWDRFGGVTVAMYLNAREYR
jgi:hypothetical protein